jgi:crossover junction endodeoxyribonuclease RusA
MKLILTFPPTINTMYPGIKQRHKSAKYVAWIKEATIALNKQKTGQIDKPIRISYKYGRPDKRKRDLSNLIKAVEDLLVSYGILEDDSLIHAFSTEWADVVGVELEIAPIQ